MSNIHNDKRIFVGSSIRAFDDGRIEGMLVPFTTAQEKDFYRTYFDKRTDYGLDAFPVVNAPALYQHGLDKTLQVKPVGRVTRLKVDDVGLWIEAQLALKDEYDKAVHALAKRGLLSWSSGALPQSVIEADDGHIDRWYIIEASLTPTPATPNGRTQISAIRSISDLASLPSFAELTAKENDGKTVSERALEIEISEQDNEEGVAMTRDEIKVILTELLAEMGLAPAAVDVEAVEDMMAADVEKLMVDEKLTDEARSIIITNAARAIQAQSDKRKAAVRSAAQDAMRSAVQPTDGVSKTRDAGVRSASERMAADSPVRGGVSSVRDMEFDYHKTSDLALAGLMRQAQLRHAGLDDEYMGEKDRRLVRALAQRLNDDMAGKGGAKMSAESIRAVRSAMPYAFRADELNASDLTGQGLEWIKVAYGDTVWEAVREIRIYEALQRKGMQVKEVPLGAKEAIFYTEGADPVAYNSPEANSVDATGRPEIVVGINPFGTGQVTASLAYTKLASSFTMRLQDSTPVNIATQLNYQMREKAMETIEQLFMNGDTATAANTNINKIDGTPTGGIFAPYYLGLNGFRKFGLVTNPTRSANGGGVINSEIFKQALGLLPSKVRARKDRLAYVLSAGAEQAALSIPELLTRDVAGERFATLENGVFSRIWGVDSFTSGFVLPANTAGKISVTDGNNTTGTVMLIYAPYWGFGFQRAFNIEVVRDPLSDTNTYVGGFSMSLVSRSNDAMSIIYNTESDGI